MAMETELVRKKNCNHRIIAYQVLDKNNNVFKCLIILMLH